MGRKLDLKGMWLIFFWIGFNAWFALTFAVPVALSTIGAATGQSGWIDLSSNLLASFPTRTPIFLIAPSGASFDRASEILSELNFIGARAVFIGDTRPPVAPGIFIPIAIGLPEEFSPLLAALPISLFAFHLSRASGRERFEFSNPEAAREHYETIHRVTQGEPA